MHAQLERQPGELRRLAARRVAAGPPLCDVVARDRRRAPCAPAGRWPGALAGCLAGRPGGPPAGEPRGTRGARRRVVAAPLRRLAPPRAGSAPRRDGRTGRGGGEPSHPACPRRRVLPLAVRESPQ